MMHVQDLKQKYWALRESLRQPPLVLLQSVSRSLMDAIAFLLDKLTEAWNLTYLRTKGIAVFPSARLRQRVSGEPDLHLFLRKGRKCSRDIIAALNRQHRPISSFKSILDFGCGCGRTLIWLTPAMVDEFYGTDIDVEAIDWCEKNYRGCKFGVNAALPPLNYSDDQFELIYAISIFTHLNEEFQFRWLEELKRITKPDGILLVTLHGEYIWQNLNPETIAQLNKTGIYFLIDDNWKNSFPEWYQSTFHTKDYVFRNFSKYFKVLDYIPRGMNHHQDIVVLQKE